MNPTLIRVADVAAQRWRNGGGLTRELLAWPLSDDWRVRLSVADIEIDGPFSAYPGVQRWFAVLEGAGVELTIDGTPHRLRRTDAPLSFSGDAKTYCRLANGPTRDLNLMLRSAPGLMLRVDPGNPWSPPAGAACGVFSAVSGRCADVDVPRHALLWFFHPPSVLRFEASERADTGVGWWLAAMPDGGRK